MPGGTHTDRRRMVVAGILLLVPIVALVWMPGSARTDPELLGFPFSVWYLFLWVFLCAATTWGAYLLMLSARRDTADRSPARRNRPVRTEPRRSVGAPSRHTS